MPYYLPGDGRTYSRQVQQYSNGSSKTVEYFAGDGTGTPLVDNGSW